MYMFQSFLYVCATALLGAALWIWGKFSLIYLGWIDVTFWRIVFTFLFTFPLFRLYLKKADLKHVSFWCIGLLSILNIGLYMYGIQFTTAGMGQLMYLSIPFITIFLNYIFLHIRVTKYQLLWIGIGTVGIILLLLKKITFTEWVTLYWNLIILLAASMHAGYIVLSKQYAHVFWPWTRVSAFSLTSMFFIVWSPFIPEVAISLPVWIWLLSVVFLWACSLWLHMMTQMTTQKYWSLISSSVLYVQPFLWLLLAYVILWEKISFIGFCWWLLALIGAYIVSLQKN